MVYKNIKKAQQGIGTLVIFIALILVAAVAAGVLIQTASNLQGKAANTGSQVQQRLATGFSIIEVIANNTNDSIINAGTDMLQTTVRLSSGSDAIKLSDITMSVVTQNGKASYQGNSTSTPTQSTFGVEEVKGDASDGYINGDDVFTFSIVLNNSVGNIPESTAFTERIYPGVGQPIPIDLITPPSMVNKFTILK